MTLLKISRWMLAANDFAPKTARLIISRELSLWKFGTLSDDVILMVSELITNAERHGKPPISLTMRLAEHSGGRLLLTVQVDDTSAARPVWHMGGEEDEHCRGLGIVRTLACEHGCRRTAAGKAVWFRVPVLKEASCL